MSDGDHPAEDAHPAGSDLPTPAPRTTPETEAYWKAAGDGRLLVGSCSDCAEHFYYPRRHCPLCGGSDVEYVEAEGTGTVYARTIVRQAGGEYAEATPYVVAYVELVEGPRMLTNVVGVDPEDVEVGDRVTVVFDETDEGLGLPRFRPV